MSFIVQLPLFYLAFYFLISGLDDLSVDLRTVWGHLLRRWGKRGNEAELPDHALLQHLPQARIAIMVPLWQEAKVIEAMVETNLRQLEYRNFAFFLGVYPNDHATITAARSLALRHPNVHVVVCSRPGPTSKADCLNHIYRHIEDREWRGAAHHELMMLHDAEDTLHPSSLALVNWFAESHGMVQVPVLPFPTRISEWVHGVYCDEFAEFLSRDMRLRQDAGAFLPSNGVGTAIRREYLDALRDAQDGLLFDPDCLTEDYELGMKLAEAGCPQILLPLTRKYGDLLATREYFPRTFRAAARQRARWISGQCLQSWERHGWPLKRSSSYWFWRDRKGLWGNPLSMVALVLLVLSAVAWVAPESAFLGPWLWLAGSIPGADMLYAACTLLAVERIAVRMFLVSRVYGFRFALGVPLRMVLSTAINAQATASAIHRFLQARTTRRRLRWSKTEHSFPDAAPAPAAMAAVVADGSALAAIVSPDPAAQGVASPPLPAEGRRARGRAAGA
ncbi:MAG: glycosyl transferase family protein [Bryobacterales bacterium]|nr:glycosyl transferase family protein [Bryobacterales bacterium]